MKLLVLLHSYVLVTNYFFFLLCPNMKLLVEPDMPLVSALLNAGTDQVSTHAENMHSTNTYTRQTKLIMSEKLRRYDNLTCPHTHAYSSHSTEV